MFSSPSSRRKSKAQEIQLNLIPILDTMVTLISFLLFSSAFLAIVVIDTPSPLLAPASVLEEKLKDKPLQLTAHIQEDQILISDWTGSREAHVIPNIQDASTGQTRYDYERYHQLLVEIKTRYLTETKLILKPVPGVSYESLILLMDGARHVEKSDTPIFQKNEQGVDVPVEQLFPEVIFGNVLS